MTHALDLSVSSVSFWNAAVGAPSGRERAVGAPRVDVTGAGTVADPAPVASEVR